MKTGLDLGAVAKLHRLAYYSFIAVLFFDISVSGITTFLASEMGCQIECNPVARRLICINPLLFFALSALLIGYCFLCLKAYHLLASRGGYANNLLALLFLAQLVAAAALSFINFCNDALSFSEYLLVRMSGGVPTPSSCRVELPMWRWFK